MATVYDPTKPKPRAPGAVRTAPAPSIVPNIAAPTAVQQKVADIGARSAATQARAAAARPSAYPSAAGIEVTEIQAPRAAAPVRPGGYPSAAGIEVTDVDAERARVQGDAARARAADPTASARPAPQPAAAPAQAAPVDTPSAPAQAVKQGGRIANAARAVGRVAAPVAAAATVVDAISAGTEKDSTARYAQRFGVDEPTGDGSVGDIAKFGALRVGGFASDLGASLVDGTTGLINKGLEKVGVDGKIPSISENLYRDGSDANVADRQQRFGGDASGVADSQRPDFSNVVKPGATSTAYDEKAGAAGEPVARRGDTGDIRQEATSVPDIVKLSGEQGGPDVYTNVPGQSLDLVGKTSGLSILPGGAPAGAAPSAVPGAGGARRPGFTAEDRAAQLESIQSRGREIDARAASTEHAKKVDDLVRKSESALASGKRRTARGYAELAGVMQAGKPGGIADNMPQRARLTDAEAQLQEAQARAGEAQATTSEIAARQAQQVESLVAALGSAKDPAEREQIGARLQAMTGGKQRPLVVDIDTGQTDINGAPVMVKGLADSQGRILYDPRQTKQAQ